MRTPSPPPAPDPREIAETDAEFNRIDQYTPFGSLVYSGNARNIATQTLSPELQGVIDQRLASDSAMLGSALERQQLLDNNPIDLSQFGDVQSDIDLSNINFQGLNSQNLPQLNSPNLQGLNALPNLQGSIGTYDVPGQPSLSGVNTNANFQQGIEGTNLPGAPNLNGDIAETLGIQSQINAGDIQNSLNLEGLMAMPTDIEGYRGDVEQAFFDRQRALLDPVLADQQRAMQNRLSNRGLPESGEAYDRDTTRFLDARNRAFTDLSRNAVLAGGSEASRQLGDALAARGQGFGERLAGGQFTNNAQAQGFGQNLAQGQFANNAAAQDFAQAMNRAGFGNQAAQQGFNNQMGLANTQFGQGLAQGQFSNQSEQARLAAALASQGFNNQAQMDQFGAGLQGAEFGLGQNLAAGNFANNAAQQGFQNQADQAAFNNQMGLLGLGADQGIRNQLFGENVTGANMNNQASAQNLALQQQLLNNNNAARAQGLAEAIGIRGNQFNELQALLGGQQVQAPGLSSFYAPSQADVMGGYALNQQAQQNAYNAQASAASAFNTGLFGLGSAMMGAPSGGFVSQLFGGSGSG